MEFAIHYNKHGLLNMLFKMHSSGLHYFDPLQDEFTYVNTVSENKGAFTKRQIMSADKARDLYASLTYLSEIDYM